MTSLFLYLFNLEPEITTDEGSGFTEWEESTVSGRSEYIFTTNNNYFLITFHNH